MTRVGRTALLAVAALTMSLVGAPAAAADPAGRVTSALRQSVDGDGLAGAVAVIRDASGLRQLSAGYADVDTRAPFVLDTHVRVASITKTFAAATLLQMSGDRLVDVDAPVEVYLPGRLRGQGIDGNRITLRQLMQHTSGLPEYFGNPADLDTTGKTADDLLDMALARPAQFPPGAQRKYTNTNYVVVGLVIAAVSGRSAEAEVTRRILVPLGLAHSYFPALADRGMAPPFAHGYEVAGGRRVDVTDDKGTATAMDGSLISTAEDATAFIIALIGGRVLAPPQLTEMMTGLGLEKLTLNCGVTVWGHSGDVSGYYSMMAKPDDGPALMVTFLQGVQPGQRDPRERVLDALYCDSG